MPTPHHTLEAAETRRPERIPVTHEGMPASDWRCAGCDKLLGVHRDDRMHIRFARAHEYLVGFPVTATCRGCGTLNHASTPAR